MGNSARLDRPVCIHYSKVVNQHTETHPEQPLPTGLKVGLGDCRLGVRYPGVLQFSWIFVHVAKEFIYRSHTPASFFSGLLWELKGCCKRQPKHH